MMRFDSFGVDFCAEKPAVYQTKQTSFKVNIIVSNFILPFVFLFQKATKDFK